MISCQQEWNITMTQTISTLGTDGAYFGKDNQRHAEKQNVRLVTTSIFGIDVTGIYADFRE